MAQITFTATIIQGTQGGFGSSKNAAKSNKKTLQFSFDCSSFAETAKNIQINEARLYLTCGSAGKGSSKEFNLSGGLSGTIQSTGAAQNNTCYLNLGSGYNLPNYLKNGGGVIYSNDDSTTYHSASSSSGYYTEDYLKVTAGSLVVDYTILKSSLSNYPSMIKIGDQFSYSINSSVDSYQHSLSISINGVVLSIMEKSSSKSGTYIPPETWAQYFTNSKTTPATLTLTTYNENENLGSNYYSTTVSADGLNPTTNLEVSSTDSFGEKKCCLKNISFITAKVEGTKRQNSPITTYYLTVYQGDGNGNITTGALANYSNASGSFSFVPNISGQIILQATVVDARDNTSAISQKIVYITEYSAPSMITTDSPFYRIDSSGTITPQGEYYGFKYASVSYTNGILDFNAGTGIPNNLTMSIIINDIESPLSSNPWKSTITYPVDASYIAIVKLIDTYGTAITYTFDAPSASYLLHFLHKKNSVGIGCAAETIENGEAGKITMGWPVYLKDDIHMKDPLSISQGGTGATTVAGAQIALGIINLIYPVGSIYMSVNSTNPGALFGVGTWVAWGSGRVPVGVSSEDEMFGSAEYMGGEKTHTLTTDEMPAHTHKPSNWDTTTITEGGRTFYSHFMTIHELGSADSYRQRVTKSSSSSNPYTAVTDSQYGVSAVGETTSIGGGTAHNNLQPYITCYMWKRTA